MYWLANTSEFIFFLKKDRDLSKISHDIQVRFMESIQRLFYHVINCFQYELDKYLIALTNPRDDVENNNNASLKNSKTFAETDSTNLKLFDTSWIKFGRNQKKYYEPKLDDIIITFSSIMTLLRKCRVNVALTIQVFSQLFYYINAWLFNRILCCSELNLCTQIWGDRILSRLKLINDWAQKQGLELVSEPHLMKVTALCLLLRSSKCSVYDAQKLLSNNKFNLNSSQIKYILNTYILARNEPPVSNSFSQM